MLGDKEACVRITGHCSDFEAKGGRNDAGSAFETG
jgi:hypothetical protein